MPIGEVWADSGFLSGRFDRQPRVVYKGLGQVPREVPWIFGQKIEKTDFSEISFLVFVWSFGATKRAKNAP